MGLRAQLAGLSDSERANVVLALVRAEVVAVVGRDAPQAVEGEYPWRRLGIYRELAAELCGRLAAATGLRIPATVLFDCRGWV